MKHFLNILILFLIMFSCRKSKNVAHHSDAVSKSKLNKTIKNNVRKIAVNFEGNQRKIQPIYRVIPIYKRYSKYLLDTNRLYNHFRIFIRSEINDTLEITLKGTGYQSVFQNINDRELFIVAKYDDISHSLIFYDNNRTHEKDSIQNINLGNKKDKVIIIVRSKAFNTQFKFYLSPKYLVYKVNYYSKKIIVNLHKYDYAADE